jgi:hypothetical protein
LSGFEISWLEASRRRRRRCDVPALAAVRTHTQKSGVNGAELIAFPKQSIAGAAPEIIRSSIAEPPALEKIRAFVERPKGRGSAQG